MRDEASGRVTVKGAQRVCKWVPDRFYCAAGFQAGFIVQRGSRQVLLCKGVPDSGVPGKFYYARGVPGKFYYARGVPGSVHALMDSVWTGIAAASLAEWCRSSDWCLGAHTVLRLGRRSTAFEIGLSF
eukprot:364975-Chlamydomonas_euryale.AAC.4